MESKFGILLNEVRAKNPLVHHITNYVTVNDCANITLAIGASPVMADDLGEAADIAAIASSVVLNMGTLNERTIPSMIAAGKSANEKGIPVVFDPVGAGASKLRNETAASLISEVKVSVLRGNISEIKFIAGLRSETKGVDASESDIAQGDNREQIAKELAQKLGCVVVISGAIDTVSDGNKTVCIENGHAMLGNLTGTGCMCSSLIGAFCGASPGEPFMSAVAAMSCMGIAGQNAYEVANQTETTGTETTGKNKLGSFRVAIHDAVGCITGDILEEQAQCREA